MPDELLRGVGGSRACRAAAPRGPCGRQGAGVLWRRRRRAHGLTERPSRPGRRCIPLPLRRTDRGALLGGEARGGRGQAARVAGRPRRAGLLRGDALQARHAPAVPAAQLRR